MAITYKLAVIQTAPILDVFLDGKLVGMIERKLFTDNNGYYKFRYVPLGKNRKRHPAGEWMDTVYAVKQSIEED